MALEVWCPDCEESYHMTDENTKIIKKDVGPNGRYDLWSQCPKCKQKSGVQLPTKELKLP